MTDAPLFLNAGPYQDDVLALPVTDINAAAKWYAGGFGMTEVARHADPLPTVLLERDGVRIGFAENGGDSSQDGAAIEVTDIARAHAELTEAQVKPGEIGDEDHDGQTFRRFFVIAPDGLYYYFYQRLT